MSDTPERGDPTPAEVETFEKTLASRIKDLQWRNQQLERDRARLIEALNYWMPDESMVDPIHSEKWNEHVALLKELTDRSI